MVRNHLCGSLHTLSCSAVGYTTSSPVLWERFTSVRSMAPSVSWVRDSVSLVPPVLSVQDVVSMAPSLLWVWRDAVSVTPSSFWIWNLASFAPPVLWVWDVMSMAPPVLLRVWDVVPLAPSLLRAWDVVLHVPSVLRAWLWDLPDETATPSWTLGFGNTSLLTGILGNTLSSAEKSKVGRFSLWIRMRCCLRWDGCEKAASHWKHWKGFRPECVNLWRFKFHDCENVAEQISQL